NADEMGSQSYDEILKRLQSSAEYVKRFEQAFGRGPITIAAVGKAISAYERTLVAGNSPFDRYLAGNFEAMSSEARRGMILFRGKARCNICHTSNQGFQAFQAYPFLSDGNYRNTGVAAGAAGFDAISRKAIETLNDSRPGSLDELAKQPNGAL